ncbi:MAG: potassium channel family protein [Candidatus Cloacimonetes bacterium]|nr:potassium channel family protein [Candidatus Cloacimonadota bacterium]
MLLFYLIPRKYRTQLKYKKTALLHLGNVILTFFISCIFFTIGFKFFENSTWIEAIWQTWQTATTVGYGNAPAEGLGGRFITIVFGTIVISYLPVIIGHAIDLISSNREKRRFGFMKNKQKNGYIIFNYPGANKLKRFIEEIRNTEIEIPICIVDAKLEELPREIVMLGDIHFVKGGLIDKETYQLANLKNSKTILVFPNESGSPEADSTTQTIVQLIEQFVDNQKTRVIHVLVDPKHSWLFDNTLSTQVLEDIGMYAAVQECQDPFSAKIIEKILTNTEGANPQTVKPDKIIGWTWGEFLTKLVEISINYEIKINAFALIQNSSPDTCPAANITITKDDFISVLADNNFVWSEIEKKLVLSKT